MERQLPRIRYGLGERLCFWLLSPLVALWLIARYGCEWARVSWRIGRPMPLEWFGEKGAGEWTGQIECDVKERERAR